MERSRGPIRAAWHRAAHARGAGVPGRWAASPPWDSARCCIGAPAWAQPPDAPGPRIDQRSGLLKRFAGTPEFLPPDPRRDYFYNTRYADRGTISHIQLVPDPGTLRPGLEDARHRERLSLLLRHARPEHDRFLEPALVAPAPLLPGAGPPVAAGRDVLPDGLLRADLRPRPDRARTRALSVSRSTSTGSTAADRRGVTGDGVGANDRIPIASPPLAPSPAIVRGSAATASRRPRP